MATLISDGKVVTLRYDLHEGGPEGELIERMDVNYPLTFLFGAGKMLPAFEDELRHLSDRGEFAFTLAADRAYGVVRPDQILRLDRQLFAERDGHIPPNLLTPGNFVHLTANDGCQHTGKVLGAEGQEVLVDFNHHLAGKAIHFRGAVLHVRAATPDELARNHHLEATGVRHTEQGW